MIKFTRIIPTLILVLTLAMGLNVSALTSLDTEASIEKIAIKLANETVQGGYNLLTMEEVKQILDAKEDVVLIDAHPLWEFEMAYIDGAQHFGFKSNYSGVWEQDLDMPTALTQDDYKAVLGADLDKKVIIYCGFTKCGRSHNAAMWAKKMGYTNIHRAPGGITSWKDHGYLYKVVPNADNLYPNK